MDCPYCGGDLSCKDSRPSPMNTIRRIKECVLCKKRITTYEYIGQYPTRLSEVHSKRANDEKRSIAIIAMC